MKCKLIQKYPGLPDDWMPGFIIGIGDYNKNQLFPVTSDSNYTQQGVEISEVHQGIEMGFWKDITALPLFTTVDGKDKFFGEKYYFVLTSEITPFEKWCPLEATADGSHEAPALKPPLGPIQFHSFKEAWQWIYDNKPVLSYKETESIIGLNSSNSKDFQELYEFTKSRIQDGK